MAAPEGNATNAKSAWAATFSASNATSGRSITLANDGNASATGLPADCSEVTAVRRTPGWPASRRNSSPPVYPVATTTATRIGLTCAIPALNATPRNRASWQLRRCEDVRLHYSLQEKGEGRLTFPCSHPGCGRYRFENWKRRRAPFCPY